MRTFVIQNNLTERIFPAKVEELDNASAFIEDTLSENLVPMKIIMSILVCFEEMFVNVGHYAYKDEDGQCFVSCSVEDRCVSITLKDFGTPFNPLAKEDPDITLGAEERDIGGLGIFMVKKAMDEVLYEYTDEQNIFTMRKNF